MGTRKRRKRGRIYFLIKGVMNKNGQNKIKLQRDSPLMLRSRAKIGGFIGYLMRLAR